MLPDKLPAELPPLHVQKKLGQRSTVALILSLPLKFVSNGTLLKIPYMSMTSVVTVIISTSVIVFGQLLLEAIHIV